MAGLDICAITAVTVTILLLTAPHAANAVSCGNVASALNPCMTYAKTGQGSPSASCCSGVRSLNSMASTSSDRQAVCNCLKNFASSTSIKAGAAASIPGKCGVSVPYAISTSTDCSKYVYVYIYIACCAHFH
jgi:Protease inhibitor/seed storage/LTP family